MNKLSTILLLLFALMLSACTGDSGDNNTLVIEELPDITLEAIAGPDQNVNEGEEVVLEGSSEASEENLSLSYSWDQVGGIAVELSGADSQVASFSTSVDADANLSFRLLVRDDSGLEATDELVVGVNNAPTAVIEGTSSVVEGVGAILDGWQSTDSDGGSVISYAWRQLAGNSATLFYEDQATVSFNAPSVSGDANLSFELAVTDDDGAVGRATVTVEVIDDPENPSITAVYLSPGKYGIGTSMTITLEAANAETGLALKDGSNFNGQELTDFAPISGQDGNYTAIYTVADNNPSRADGASASANIVLVDPAGNESAAVAEILLDGVSIDTLPPAISSVSVSEGIYGIGASVEITLIAADSEVDLSLRSGSTFNGQELTDFAALPDQQGYYTAIYTVASGDLDHAPYAEVNTSIVVLDPSGNESPEHIAAILSEATSIDANAPTVSSVDVASGAYGIGDDVRISITAADGETGLVLSPDANSFNGRALSQFDHIASGVYSAIYTVTEGDDDIADNSSASINIALVDAHGNVGGAEVSVELSNSSIDANKPRLSAVSISEGIYGIGTNLVIYLSEAESEVGLELLDSTFNGNSIAGFSDLQNGFYALTYTVAEGDTDQAAGAEVEANITFADSVGNTSTSITAISLSGASIDATAPIIESISVAEGAYLIGDELLVYIDAVNSESDLRLRPGSSFNGQELSNFRSLSNAPSDYIATYTVVADDPDVDVGGDAISDIAVLDTADNPSIAITSVNVGDKTSIGAKSINIDSIAIGTGVHRIGSRVRISIDTADGDVDLLLKEGSSFNGQLLTDFTAIADDAGAYEAYYTVTSGDPDVALGGEVSVDITLVDAAGNESDHYTSLTLSADTSIDANAPGISALTIPAGTYAIGDTIEIAISALNAETNLFLADGSSFNGQDLTGFSSVDGQDGDYLVTYTVTEGDSDVADGSSVTTSIALADASGNPSPEIPSVLLSGASIDANRPNITSIVVASGVYGVGDDVVITLTTSANDTGLTLVRNSFNGATLGALIDNGDGTYTTTYTVTEGDADLADGDSVITAIAFVDSVGNLGDTIESLPLEGTSIDANSPSVDSIVVDSGIYKVGDYVTYTIIASNNEAGLILSTLDTFAGARLEGVSDNRDGTYSARYTVEEGDADVADGGAVDVNISFTDSAGNDGPSFTTTNLPAGTSIDANSPGIALVSVAAGSYGVGVAVPVTVTADNAEIGLSLSSRRFNGNNLTGITDNLNGSYSASYIVEEGDTDVADGRTVVTNLAFADPSGNVGAAENLITLSGASIDANSPTITSISVAAGDYIVGDDIVITITAGAQENDLGLKSGSSFHGQELSEFKGTSSDGVYTAIYTVAVGDASLAYQDTVSVNIALIDATGNESAAVTEFTLGNTSTDTTVPSIYDVFVSEDNIINTQDDLTRISVTGSTTNVENNRPVDIEIGDVFAGALVSADQDNNGGFSAIVNLSSIKDGTYPVTVDVTDASGNPAQYTGSVLVDITPPTQTIKDIALSHDTGSSDDDFITNVSSQTISATLSSVLGSGDTLHGSVDSGATWHDITESSVSSRAISWETVDLTLTSGLIMFKVTDAFGSDGVVAQQVYTLDKTDPTQTIGSIALSNDTGALANDFVTNIASQVISAQLSEELEAGDTLHVSADFGANWRDITANVSGTTISWATTLTSGSYQFKVTDIAGNDGAIAEQDYILDTTPPTQTISAIDFSADTGTSSNDFITKATVQNISATLSIALAAGDALYGSSNSGTDWTDITTDSISNDLDILWEGVTLTSGFIQFKVVDLAGNDGAITEQFYTLDIFAPTQQIIDISLSADNGTYDNDFITNQATQTIGATLLAALDYDAGDTLRGSVDSGTSWINITSSVSNKAIEWSTILTSGAIQLKVVDIAGNDGQVTGEAYTLDIDKPTQSISAIALSADSGTEDDDFITNTTTQTITAELDAILEADDILYGSVALDQSSEPIWIPITNSISTTDNLSITWENISLSSGGAIQFKVVDLAGNDGAVAAEDYTLDITKPPQSISAIKLSDDNGPLNTDFITNVATQTITAELNATLGADDILYGSVAVDDSGATIWHDITTSSVSGTLITWQNVTLSSGTIQFKVVDIAGNDGDVAQQAYTLDEDKPTQSISAIALSADSGTSATDFTTKTADQTISATLSAGLGDSEAVYASVDSGSHWQDITSTSVNDTAITWNTTLTSGSIMFKVVDTAGNDGDLTSRSYTLDTTPPDQSIAILALSTDTGEFTNDFITSEPSQTITAELNASLGTNDILYGSVASGDNGPIWDNITSTADDQSIIWKNISLSSGAIQFKVVDHAGNDGDIANQAYTLDTTAPTQTITSLALSTDSGTSSDDFITNVAAQSISATLSAALAAGEAIYASVEASADLLKIYNDANLTGNDSAQGSINFSWSTELTNGANTLSFQVIDLAGNVSSGTTKAYTLDTESPTQSIDELAFSADNGTTGDFITNDSSQTITAKLSASLEDGDSLHGSVDSGTTWDDITNSINTDTNAITWSGAALQIGTHDLILRITDSADNNYTLEQQYTLDQTNPSIVTSGTASSVNEALAAALSAVGSSDDASGIASYAWAQVASDGSAWSGDTLAIADASAISTTVSTPGIAEDSVAEQKFYFAVTITDTAGNSATSSPLTLTVTNTHITPAITTSAGAAPDFGELSLIWTPTDSLTYKLYRSSAADCDLTSNCTDDLEYAAADLSSGAYVDSGLDFFTPYYYWLEAQYAGAVVSLNSEPIEANTTGPVLNDTGITSGGDYPSGFDDNNDGVAGDGNGALCDGGYLDSANNNVFVEFIGEDCELGADFTNNDPDDGNAAFSFTRLNLDGSLYAGNGVYSEEPWSCVLDHATGLIWEVKTNDNSTLRDKDQGFTWYNPNHGQTDQDGNPITFYGTEGAQDTQDFIAYANTEVNNGNGLCGRSDWRLPTVHEIQGLADYDVVSIDSDNETFLSSPALDTDYFPNARIEALRSYWTANLNVNPEINTNQNSSTDNYFAWVLNTIGTIASGTSTAVGSTNSANYVRLVSSSAAVASHFSDYSNSRYTDHADGTISDAQTGLMWMQCTYGQVYDSTSKDCSSGSAESADWQQAFANAAESNAHGGSYGYNDWRLPNVKELGSIVDFGSHSPAINQSIFPNTIVDRPYWTSTPFRADDSQALAIHFSAGDYLARARNTTAATYLRLVRDNIKTPRIITLDINGNNIINAAASLTNISVSGTTNDVEDDQQITLVIDSNTFYIDVSADSFDTTINLSNLEADGEYTITADVSDIDGRAALQFSSTIIKDTKPPTIDRVTVAEDNIINSTDATSTTITGSTVGVEDGQTISITISDDAEPVNEITTSAEVTNDTFTIVILNLSTLADGADLSLTADVADSAGNSAPQFTASGIIKDTVAPTITSILVSGDDRVSAQEAASPITVSGSVADIESGAEVSLDVGGVSATASVDDQGDFTVDVALSSLTTDDSYSVSAAVSDAVGNAAPDFTSSFVLDTTAPTITSVLIAGDNLVNSSEQTSSVAVSGRTSDVEDGQIITLTINGADITATVTGNAFTATTDLSSLTDGTYPVTANVADAAGNPADSASFSFEIDTTDPTQSVTADSISLSNDSGTDSTDFITNEAEQDISATLSDSLGAGDVLYASIDGGANWSKIYTDENLTTTNFSWSTTLLNGTSSIQFQVADAADNNGTLTEQSYTLDTTAPTQTISGIDLSPDTGASSSDFITTTNGPDPHTITATLSAALGTDEFLFGAVKLNDAGNPDWTDITTSVISQAISWDVSLSSGENDIQLIVEDAAGNSGQIAEQNYTFDNQPPTIDTTDTTTAAEEASVATLDASKSSDNYDIASYEWTQVQSDGSALSADDIQLTIVDADSDTATVSTPGIADDDISSLSFYFSLRITDVASNGASETVTLTVNNTHLTPAITATAGVAPDFDQLSLSWTPTDDDLTYNLHRSTAANCDLSATTNCANYLEYAALDLSSSAHVDSDLQFFTPHYYWLEVQSADTVVALSSTPLEANTTGPVLNDTGITSGGDYPSGFDANNGLADGADGAVCNGGYLVDDQDAVIADPSTYTGTTTFVPFTAEDCELGRDANSTLNDPSDGNAGFSFTKLDLDGTVLPADASAWSCVLDNVTGLIWEVKTTDGTWRDRNTGFTWYNPDHGQEFDKDGNPITFYGTEGSQDTQDFIDYVKGDSSVNNGSGLCGSTDWRLPTVHEIKGLADYDAVSADGLGGYSSPSIDTDYFPHALASQYNWYWTSHLNVDPDVNPGGDGTVAGSSTSNYYAWAYNSAESRTRSGTGSTVGSTVRSNYVRLVSSSAAVASHFSDYSDDRYTDNGDGTISDARTGLMWMQCSYGQTYDGGDTNSDGIICEGSPTFGSWQQAFAWAADSNANVDYGYNDWRLPNIKELGSIVDFGSAIPAINQSIFPNTSTGSYWTSTPSKALDVDSNDDNQSASIWFHTGDHGLNKRTANLYLRLVRDDVKTPRILTVNISDDNIIGSLDNFTDISVSGTTDDVEADQKITLVINTTTVDAEIKEDGSFTTTIDLSGIADGTYSVTANVSDINEKPANQFTGSFLVDTVTPTIDSVSATAGIYGIGASVPLTITATDAETGLTLTSTTFNGQSLGAVTDNNDGTYTTTYTVIENDTDIADGGTVITDLAFTDPAGNAGEATTSVTLIGASIDAHRPTIASVGVATGTHGIGASVAITITAGSSETGLDLTSATFNGATLGSVNDKGDGTYNATYTVEEGNAHVADGGSVSVDLVFTDPAGNAGIAFESVTLPTGTSIDTTPPKQTISDIDLIPDSGKSDADFVTNTNGGNTHTITATLSAALDTGDVLWGAISLDGEGEPAWIEIDTSSVSNLSISWDTHLSNPGSNEIQLKVEDAAGNSGAIAKQDYFYDIEEPKISFTINNAAEASTGTLDASTSTDNYDIASYEWTQVESDGSDLLDTSTELVITGADSAIASVSTPGIADDDVASINFYFSLRITDVAGNLQSTKVTLTVDNTYTSPDITASASAPHFDQLSLSWQTETGLTYDLYRSSDPACNLSEAANCADPALYAALDLSSGAQVDSDLKFFTPYYYWLQAQLNDEVVSLSSTPTEANTTGPALNDTGVTQGGDYPSGFDTLGGGAVCNGGYLIDDNGDVIADPDNHSGNSTFVAFEDEDCELGRDSTNNDSSDGHAGFSYTRLNSNGSEYTGSGDYGTDPWSCVVDNVTGLTWEVKTDDGTLRDRDQGFTWYDPDNTTFTGTPSDYDTDDFIIHVNSDASINSGNGLCGQTNWRLPTVQELVGISDFSTYEPVVDTSYFPNARTGASEWSWTADLNSDTANLPGYAWLYSYYTGSTRSGGNGLGTTSSSRYVRLVSSSEVVKSYFNDYSSDGGRYTDHGDGTVSDNRTGLMWMKCIYGQAHNLSDNSCGVTGVGAGGTWQEAFAKVAAINEGVGIFGYTDWRLPNMKELLSLVDLSSFEPPINQAIFPSTDGQSQWTSTLSAQDGGDAALAVGFSADPEFGVVGKTVTTSRFRLVRDDVNTPRILTLDINGDNVINSEDDLANILVSGSTIDVEDGQQITLVVGSKTFYIDVSADGFEDTIDLSDLADGTYSVTADVSDSAGKEANQFTSTLLKDTEPPSITLVVVATDNIINSTEASAATISGTTDGVENDQILSLSISDGTTTIEQTATVTNNAFTTTAVDLSSLADGDDLSLTADVADAAGNEATQFTNSSIVKDVAAPTITISNIASDSPTNSTINASEVDAVVIKGTASENGQTVSLAITDATNTLEATTTVTNGSYNAEVDLSSLDDSTSIVLKATVADIAGNETTATATGITKDATAPSINSISIAGDNFVGSSEISNPVAVSGSTTGVEDGQQITLTIGTTKEVTATIASDLFSTTASLTSFGEGTHAVTANVADAAGNPADEATSSVEIDTSPPSQKVDPESIQLSSATDFLTNQATQTISAELDAVLEAGDVLNASVDSGANWQQVDSSNISDTSISWPTTLAEGTNTIQFQVADSAGNTGPLTQKDYTLDTTDPTQTISDIAISHDSGYSSTDFITGTFNQTITATLSAALDTGDILWGSFRLNGVGDPDWTDITSFVSDLAISWGVTFGSGSHDIQFKVEDAAGNSVTIAKQPYTLDNKPPDADTAGSDTSADEASTAILDGSNSTDDLSGIYSYLWRQVQSTGADLADDDTVLSIADASAATTTVATPSIVDDSGADQTFYFSLIVTDNAGNQDTATAQAAITVTNTYTTPTITATAVGAPDFDQISLSWDADTNLTYSLYRSTQYDCDLSSYSTCANPALYTDSTGGITISGTNASITDTDSSANLQLFNSYYYWLGAQIGTEVVSLNTIPIAATNSGPVLNDTGITSGGDYPSGFDNHNGSSNTCDGGYIDSNDDDGDPDTTDFIAFVDEDCEVGRDANATLNDDSDGNAAFVFTKLDISGNVTTSTTIGDWSCVLDHTTGLIWEVKTNDGTLRDPSKFFTWYNPNHGQDSDNDGNTINFDGTASDQDTQDFIAYVNSDSSINNGNGLCGQTNWRLPTVHEIEGLADYDAVVANDSGGYSTPSIDTNYFPYTITSQYQWYWTSHLNVDPDVNTGGGSSTSNYFAWAYGSAESRTRSGTGGVTVGDTARGNYVRLVSSSAAVASHFSDYSDDRYTDNGDGTISDHQTGLMWMQCSYGQTYDGNNDDGNQVICEGSPAFGNWQQAFAWAADSNANSTYGYNDWRLPNIKELGSIVDFGSAKPAINQSIFPNTISGPYWTSTPSRANVLQTIFIGFQAGDYGPSDRISNLYIRLVRNLN